MHRATGRPRSCGSSPTDRGITSVSSGREITSWGQLVFGRGLESSFYRQHAHGGLDTTFSLFQAALDWVADNTPRDDRTVRIEAVVTFWVNGLDPVQRIFVSPDRVEASQ